MLTTEQLEQANDLSRHNKEAIDAVIREQVLHCLGTPADLFRLQVQHLWEDHYRVNVFRGVNAASVCIAESYFIEVGGNGNIVASTPPITRRY